MHKILKVLLASFILLASSVCADDANVVLVTLDGVRWQEVFSGADKNLISNKDFVKRRNYWRQNKGIYNVG